MLSRKLRTTSISLVLCLAVGGFAYAQSGPTCVEGTVEVFAATGVLQNYEVPNGTTLIQVDASGASGGNVLNAGGRGNGFIGGNGVRVVAHVPVVPLDTLSVVVGVQGGEGARGGSEPGGGGGGSFVFDAANLLVAAGGGGGAGITDDGHDAVLTENGDSADGPDGGDGGTMGLGGLASTNVNGNGGAGGGGFLGSGGDHSTGVGTGGDQISPPGTAAGGTGDSSGGYGGGGGAGGPGGGGGGGFSGGGGGWGKGVDGGGGGGLFIETTGNTIVTEVLLLPGPGAVTICALNGGESVLEVPSLGGLGIALLISLLAFAGVLVTRKL